MVCFKIYSNFSTFKTVNQFPQQKLSPKKDNTSQNREHNWWASNEHNLYYSGSSSLIFPGFPLVERFSNLSIFFNKVSVTFTFTCKGNFFENKLDSCFSGGPHIFVHSVCPLATCSLASINLNLDNFCLKFSVPLGTGLSVLVIFFKEACQ